MAYYAKEKYYIFIKFRTIGLFPMANKFMAHGHSTVVGNY